MQNKLSISAIKELCNQNPDCFFFSKDTMRFYRQAGSKYSVSHINGVTFVTVTYTPPGTHSINYAHYELTEKQGRYSLHYVEALPESK
jgi:hypothetical protein